MASQTNSPRDWRLLAEDDLAIAEHMTILLLFMI